MKKEGKSLMLPLNFRMNLSVIFLLLEVAFGSRIKRGTRQDENPLAEDTLQVKIRNSNTTFTVKVADIATIFLFCRESSQ